jgi:hypothetical protein
MLNNSCFVFIGFTCFLFFLSRDGDAFCSAEASAGVGSTHNECGTCSRC